MVQLQTIARKGIRTTVKQNRVSRHEVKVRSIRKTLLVTSNEKNSAHPPLPFTATRKGAPNIYIYTYIHTYIYIYIYICMYGYIYIGKRNPHDRHMDTDTERRALRPSNRLLHTRSNAPCDNARQVRSRIRVMCHAFGPSSFRLTLPCTHLH